MHAPGMPAERLPDWPARLAALVQQRQGEPFAWGPNDCASFAADAALALLGHDVLAELRAPRRNQREAARAIRAGGGLPAALERAGLRRVAPELAQRGDLLLLPQGRQRVLVVNLGDSLAAPGTQGLHHAGLHYALQAVAAWRVGVGVGVGRG
jgi:hypothetical protein